MTRSGTVATWERLVRYHRTTTRTMDRRLRSSFGFSLDDYDVLYQVRVHDGPIRMGDLAERLLVANSSCNRIVTRLVSAGLLARREGPDDGRVVLVDLTAEGRRLQRRMAAAHTRDITAALGAPLTEAQLDELDTILTDLATSTD